MGDDITPSPTGRCGRFAVLPPTVALRTAEFATTHARLLKVAARVIETASRIRIAFASACPDAALFRSFAVGLRTASP